MVKQLIKHQAKHSISQTAIEENCSAAKQKNTMESLVFIQMKITMLPIQF